MTEGCSGHQVACAVGFAVASCDSSDCALCHRHSALRKAASAGINGSLDAEGAFSSQHSSQSSESQLRWGSDSLFQGTASSMTHSQISDKTSGGACTGRKRQRPDDLKCSNGSTLHRRLSVPSDALVPTQSRSLSRCDGSYTHLAVLDTCVPQEQAASGSSGAAVSDSSPSADVATGSSDVLPQLQLAPQQSSKVADDAAVVPANVSQQQQCGDAEFLELLGSANGETGMERNPARRPSLSQVAAFERPRAAAPAQRQADIVCGVDFSSDGWHIATAGIRKQVRLYSLAAGFASDAPAPAVAAHRMPAKLSSLAWCPDATSVVTVGDYDGDVSQIDLETGHHIVDVDGHAGRRIWSVAHSVLRPHFCAAASDDGSASLWGGPSLSQQVGSLLMPAPGWALTGVDFCAEDEHALLLSCANGRAYVYDLRNSNAPRQTLDWHTGAVSYARFCGRATAATASIDGTIAAWDLADAGDYLTAPSTVMRGHANRRNFVGLSVLRAPSSTFSTASPAAGHVVACGSEDAVVHAYSTSAPDPLTTWRLAAPPAGGGCAQPFSGSHCNATAAAVVPDMQQLGTTAQQHANSGGAQQAVGAKRGSEYVSTVAWAPPACAASSAPLLAVAASDGDLRVLTLE